MSEDQLSTMEAEALKRKERLKALKSSSKSRQDDVAAAAPDSDETAASAVADKK